MIETKAPKKPHYTRMQKPTVFLAGSIEMGAAPNWQADVVESLSDLDVHIMNPRRDDWDSTWEQSIHNKQFNQQVSWEMFYLQAASVVFMYFDPGTKAPITLLELGLIAGWNTDEDGMTWGDGGIVVCPEGFWRRGNVEMVCSKFELGLHDSLENGLVALREGIENGSYI